MIRLWKIVIVLFNIILCYGLGHCEYLYRDFITGFADISQFENNEKHIEICNTTNQKIFETKFFNVSRKNFCYKIRLKTENQGKISQFIDKSQSMTYGVVWNYLDSQNYYAIQISQREDNQFDDIFNKRYLRAGILKIQNNNTDTLLMEDISSRISLENEYNSIQIKKSNDKTTISIGNKELFSVFSTQELNVCDSIGIGYYVEPKSHIKIKRIQFDSTPQKQYLGITKYSSEQLDSIFSGSIDPIEGYWTYLDRNMDESKAKLGGKYQIAIIKTENNNYNILYCTGARILTKIWKPYMLKGELISTPFKNHFDVKWIDSEKNTITDESYADYKDFILTLIFPRYKTQLRFRKER